MANQTLNISLAGPATDEGEYLLIEQEDWAKDVGRTSSFQGVLAIGSMIFGGSIPLPNCGGLAGFDTPIYVYPSSNTLRFVFDVSHGNFTQGAIHSLMREEVINCGLQDSTETDYPVAGSISMQWIGPCYDIFGNIIARPSVSRSGRKLFFDKKVYGSLRVKYEVYRVTYNLHIEEREYSIENNFSCVAFARFDGGVEYLEVKAPSGYEETKGNCGNGIYNGTGVSGSGSAAICTPGRGKGTYPEAVRADRFTDVEYCAQEITSDRIVESEESANEPGDECSDGPITTN